MLHKEFRQVWITLILGIIVTVLGCSGGGSNPTAPSNSQDVSQITYKGGTNLGEFTLSLDQENLTGDIEYANRQESYNAAHDVTINIEGLQWDPTTRVWDVNLSVTNPTTFTAYGPCFVFTDIGEQKILDQDGFVYSGTNRLPIVAFCKDNAQRVFNASSTEPVHLRIYWPIGCSNFSPMRFVVDVSYPGVRQEPMVENLSIVERDSTDGQFNLVAYIKDWQTPPSGQTGINAWVDLTPVGGAGDVALYDDGLHGDGVAGDSVWGCYFDANLSTDYITLTVHAVDWENYKMENDVQLAGIDISLGIPGPGNPDCQPMRRFIEGERSLIHELKENIFTNQDSWARFWATHDDIHPVPRVDFTTQMVIAVVLGDRPTSGYHIRFDCAKYSDDPSTGNTIKVAYTELIPGEKCPKRDVITQPFNFVLVPVFLDSQATFERSVKEFNWCPPPNPGPPRDKKCVMMRPVAMGETSLLHELTELVITTQDSWTRFWTAHGDAHPVPQINFEKEMVVAVVLGDRRTGGHHIRYNCIRFVDDSSIGKTVLVDYTEIIPGRDCPAPQVITQPFNFVAVPKFPDARAVFIRGSEIRDCPPVPPQCRFMKVIDMGPMSGIHRTVEKVIRDMDSWKAFWALHKPDAPLPPVNFDKEMVVAVVLGERPTTGYAVKIECIMFNKDPNAPQCEIGYTEKTPDRSCITQPVITTPYQLVLVEKFVGTDVFRHRVVPGPCEPPKPPDCLPMDRIDEGIGGFHRPVEKIIRDKQSWNNFWQELHPGKPVPPIDFTCRQIVVVMLGERPSTGFKLHIDCVKQIKSPDSSRPPFTHVDYVEEVPGANCVEAMILTYPYQIVATPLSATPPDEFNHLVHIYDCP